MESNDGWSRDMANTWCAYFTALATGAVREDERAAFMEFVRIVSNPIWEYTTTKGDKA